MYIFGCKSEKVYMEKQSNFQDLDEQLLAVKKTMLIELIHTFNVIYQVVYYIEKVRWMTVYGVICHDGDL